MHQPLEGDRREQDGIGQGEAEQFDLRGPGKIFMPEYAKFIAEKNVLLGSAGQLDACRAALKK